MNAVGESREDPAVRRALQRRQELQEELKQVDLFLALYEKFVGPVGGTDDTQMSVSNLWKAHDTPELGFNDLVSAVPPTPNAPAVPTSSKTPRMNNKAFVALTREILLDNGRPIEKDDLLKRIQARGLRIGGSNESETMKSKLWRAKAEIIRIQGAGYWPIDVPCSAVSYSPPIS